MDYAGVGVSGVGGGGRGQRGGREDVLRGSGAGCGGVEDDYALRGVGGSGGAVGVGARDGARGASDYDAVGAVLGDGADNDAPGWGGGFVFFVLDFHCWRRVVSFWVGLGDTWGTGGGLEGSTFDETHGCCRRESGWECFGGRGLKEAVPGDWR